MNRWRHIQKDYWIRERTVFVIILGTIFIKLLIPLPLDNSFQIQNTETDSLTKNVPCSKILRLLKTHELFSNPNKDLSLESNFTSQEYRLTPPFTINSQSGLGGGNYIVNDSLNLTNSEAIAISNTIASPETRQDDFTITVPNGFTNRSGIFNITNVKAEFDVRVIENNVSANLYVDSDDGGYGWYEVAMQFNVTEDYVNLSSLYVRIVSEQVGFDVPSGELLLVNSSWDSVNSRWKPNGTEVLSTISLGTSTGWTIPPLTFSENITLRGDRNYFIILNDTTPAGNNAYWKWGVQRDLTSVGGDSIDEGAFYYKWLTHAEDSWTYGTSANQLDLNLVISVLPVEKSGGDYFQKTYSDPTEIELLYSTSVDETNLTRFNWFEWNATSDNIHRFRTNTSVSFDLAWIINLTSVNNPLTVSASYLTTNNTVTHWNLTFSTDSVTTSYSIRNRTITINGLENDWNGTAIYLDGTLEYNSTPSGGFNTSITYSNQSSAMIINTSTLAIATDWIASFVAPNYILDFKISYRGTPLSLPYQIFTMNDYNIDVEVGATGNFTYWIDYPNGSQMLRKNINDTHTVFSDLWDINNTFDNISNVNGTYYLQAFWNNSGSSKVGTYTREVSMIVNSTFNYEYETEVILDTYLNITVYYNSTHNATVINNANVSGVPSWGSKSLIDFDHTSAYDPYRFSLEINDSQHDPGDKINVTIFAELPGYVSHSTVIYAYVVANATLTTDISQNFVLEWRENKTIEMKYNQTGGSGVLGATIAVDGDSTNVYNISNVYYYRFNSTKYGGFGTYLNLNITASHPNYLTRIWYFDLTITLGQTNITGSHEGKSLINDTTVVTQPFANSSADKVTINLQYYHYLTGDNLGTSTPTIVSPIPICSTIKDGIDHTWNITFNPNKTGIFIIKITFNLNNFKNSTFFFHLTVVKAGTKIEHKALVDIPVYYTEYYDFFLLYNNTDYNENITGLIKDSGFTINSSNVVDLNQTDEGYWFRFNPSTSLLPLDRYSINITFSHLYFNPNFIEVSFIVLSMPTMPLNITDFRYNQSIFVEDVLYIDGEGYQTIRGQNISNLDTVFLWMNDTLVMESLYEYQLNKNQFSINFTTTSFHYGNYSLTLEIGKDGYQNQNISFNITLEGRETILEVILPGKTFEQGDSIDITAILTYVQEKTGGLGAGLSLAPLEAVDVTFYIELKYENETTRVFEFTNQTDDLGQTSFIIEGKNTLGAVGFTNITVWSASGLSGLPSSYSMSSEELAEYQIIKIIDPLEIIIPIITMGTILLLVVGAVAISSIFLNRKRKQRSDLIQRRRMKIEQSFEDIKSIRLLIARHESGLQFYSEKTIAELHTDTDALSGMSAALSSFMEEVSEGMRSRTDEQKEKEKIEVMSREGLHMLIWHGKYSSFIIISEIRLPDYFKDRLANLGREVEAKFSEDLQDFYSADQVPTSQIKKMVRKHIPLHYFSAFVLNEGVLTLENLKLSGKEKKMLKLIKEIRFQKEGVQFFFSEQIISHLSKHYNRSEAIKFLDRAIDINLLIEASQEDIISIGM